MNKRNYHLFQVCIIFVIALILVSFFGSEELSGWANDRMNPTTRKIFSPLVSLHKFNSEKGLSTPVSTLNAKFVEMRDYSFPELEPEKLNPVKPTPAPKPAEETPVVETGKRSKSTVVPGKISLLLAGDSLVKATNFRFTTVASQYEDIIFRVEGVVSANLLHLNHFNWVERSATIAKEEDWDVVLVMLGTNAVQPMFVGEKIAQFNSPLWIDTYQSRAKEMIENYQNDGAEVWWIGLPPMQEKVFNDNIMILNGIIKEVCDETDCKFVEIDKIFGDENGNYVNYKVIDGKQQALRLDGIHYSYPGAQILSDFLINKVRREFKVKPGR